MPEVPKSKKLPFSETQASKEFMPEMIKVLIKEIDRRRAKFINDENIQVFNHGPGWTFKQEGKDGYATKTAEMELQQHKMVIAADRVLEQDLTLLPDFYRNLCNDFEVKLQQGIVQTMVEATEQTGNTLSISPGSSLADAFLELVKRGVASIGANGEVVYGTLMILSLIHI